MMSWLKNTSVSLLLLLVVCSQAFARGGGGHGGGHYHSSGHGGRSHSSGKSGGYVHVKAYKTKSGKYVGAHNRTSPDGTKANNWSTKGNVNPYTGKEGTKEP